MLSCTHWTWCDSFLIIVHQSLNFSHVPAFSSWVLWDILTCQHTALNDAVALALYAEQLTGKSVMCSGCLKIWNIFLFHLLRLEIMQKWHFAPLMKIFQLLTGTPEQLMVLKSRYNNYSGFTTRRPRSHNNKERKTWLWNEQKTPFGFHPHCPVLRCCCCCWVV